MSFERKEATELGENFINSIGNEWMLVTAGNSKKYNMMTASWGFAGFMWGKPCAVTCIRPQRFTKQFVDNGDYFTLSFYGDNKAIHSVCGSKSGRDTDKTAETGLTPEFDNKTGAPYFEQAHLVLICRKLYSQRLDKNCFTEGGADIPEKWYNGDDFHEMYYGEIVSALVKK